MTPTLLVPIDWTPSLRHSPAEDAFDSMVPSPASWRGSSQGAARRLGAMLLLALLAIAASGASPTAAQDAGLITMASPHTVGATRDRFAAAVRAGGWAVFGEVDHAAAAAAVGLTLRPRLVVLFGNPGAGTPAMVQWPTLALDLPMRVLIWEDEDGRVFITHSTAPDIATRVFSRHGIAMPSEAVRALEAFLATAVRAAIQVP